MEAHRIVVQRARTEDHPLLGPTDTVEYRVMARNPGEARRKVAKRVNKAHANWHDKWTIIEQEYK